MIDEVLTDLDLGTLEAPASMTAAAETSKERTPKVIAAEPRRGPASRFAWASRWGVAAAILILALPILYGSQNGWKLPASWSSVVMASAKQVALLPPWAATKARGFYSPAPVDAVATDDPLPKLPLAFLRTL